MNQNLQESSDGRWRDGEASILVVLNTLAAGFDEPAVASSLELCIVGNGEAMRHRASRQNRFPSTLDLQSQLALRHKFAGTKPKKRRKDKGKEL